jgi:cytoskeleton protein RodZ
VREAAEATKIRGDYLQKFESNQFDIGLSEIYVRGFLRSYANFLRMPADRILNDYDSLRQSDNRPRQPSREVYGRMDLSISSAEDRAERPAAPAGENPSADGAHALPHVPRNRTGMTPGPSIDPALVFKAVIGLGVILVLLLVLWAGKAILSGGPAGGATERSPSAASTPVAPAPEAMLSIIALEPVRVKIVRQSDGAELFQGELEKDERREFPNTPIWLTATALESIRLEYKGKQFMIQAKGYNRVPVDANQFNR